MNTNLNIVPYKIAKKLKECGFFYLCDYYFDSEGNIKRSDEFKDWNSDENVISAPYAFVVQQWLSNEHNVDVFACRLSNITSPMLGYTYAIFHDGSVEPITGTIPEESIDVALIKGIEYFCETVEINRA